MIPVVILTGFLGSGKSTLINRLLRDRPDWKLAVLVNEFGDEHVESSVVQARRRELEEMSISCLCCAPTDDLERAIQSLARRAKPDIIIIEASGLSDPAPIAQNFVRGKLAQAFTLASILAVIDVGQFDKRGLDAPLQLRQISLADSIILGKADLTNPDACQAWSSKQAPHARIFDGSKSLPWESILIPHQVQGLVGRLALDSGHHHGSADTWVWKEQSIIDPQTLGAALAAFPSNVLRAKGYFWLKGPGKGAYKYVFQLSPGQRHLGIADWAPGETKKSVLVCAGHELDTAFLSGLLENTRA